MVSSPPLCVLLHYTRVLIAPRSAGLPAVYFGGLSEDYLRISGSAFCYCCITCCYRKCIPADFGSMTIIYVGAVDSIHGRLLSAGQTNPAINYEPYDWYAVANLLGPLSSSHIAGSWATGKALKMPIELATVSKLFTVLGSAITDLATQIGCTIRAHQPSLGNSTSISLGMIRT
jgi:hypothetical protein